MLISSPGEEPTPYLSARLRYPARHSTAVPPGVSGPSLLVDPTSCRVLVLDVRGICKPCAQPSCPKIVSTPPRLRRTHDVETEAGIIWHVLATVDGDGKVLFAALNDVPYPDQYEAEEMDLIGELVQVVRATTFRRTDDQRASPLTLTVAFEITREDDGFVRIALREYCTEWHTTFVAIARDGVFGEWKEQR